MLDMKVLREHPEAVRQSIARRHVTTPRVDDVDRLIELDARWRDSQARCDVLRNRRNELSASIKQLDAAARPAVVEEVRTIKQELATLEPTVEQLKIERDELWRLMPNLLGHDVPEGATDEQNSEMRCWGELPQFNFAPRDHLELGRLTDTIDFDRGAKVTGSSFYFLKREAALLEQALMSFAAATLVPQGFIPMVTPDLARADVLAGIGFAPRGAEKQVYGLDEDELCLIATAEITVGGYHSGEILPGEQLPLRYLGFSHCFRREAGAHGRESRGLYRVHQFSKAEMFVLCTAEQSADEHERIRHVEESLLQALHLPYRVVSVCAGDLGAPAAKKYDLEAWMPGRQRYGEVTSCSNCTDYQARRLNIRYRSDATAPPRYVHMLNGTAIAASRTLIAIFENYQREDGAIVIPPVLRPWMAGIELIPVRC